MLRFPLAVTSGGLISIAMFWVLWNLVGAPIEVRDMMRAQEIDFSPPRIPPPPVEPPRPEKVIRDPPPPMPGLPGLKVPQGPTDRTRPQLPLRLAIGNVPLQTTLPSGSDHDALPRVRITPEYPPSAQRKGTEGWVRVQFSITATGAVRDAVVVDSDPQNVFDSAALRAMARWRYDPKIDDGVPVERVGMQTVIRFKLDE
jgi:protein TonB